MKDGLTKRERQVAELIAWGAPRKQIPQLLLSKYGGKKPISINTVNNIMSNIYAKLLLNSETELSAWYFCEYEGVDSSHSPFRDLKCKLYSILFLLILLPQITNIDQALRPARSSARSVRTQTQRGGRRQNDGTLDITDMIQ